MLSSGPNKIIRHLIRLLNPVRMSSSTKREHQESGETQSDQPEVKSLKMDGQRTKNSLKHGKNLSIPINVLKRLKDDEISILENITTSCTDSEKIKEAILLRKKYRLSVRLPEDFDDSSYYIQNGLRKVYPYFYLYQSYAKERWMGRKMIDILKHEFRDIDEEQMKLRFDRQMVFIDGRHMDHTYVVKSNDFISNKNHRHELPVLAVPIKIIYRDKHLLVVDKPPSIPVHACGRYRHNSLVHILMKEHNITEVKVIHRLDRLVSGVLLIGLTKEKASVLEQAIRDRSVKKVYVCRVDGEFPSGDPADDGEITVDQPLEIVPGKVGITVVLPEGKPSITKFKRLNFNGKTSSVMCKPETGRMHQIRVHLQYLGHPITNDTLYNCSAFGPEMGKGGRYGKSIAQLSKDVISKHRADSWLIQEDNDILSPSEMEEGPLVPVIAEKGDKFISDEEREETTSALAHYFTDETSKDMEKKWPYDPKKLIIDPTCRDCRTKYHDPPLRSSFLYLHALRYSGSDWSYESEMPVWAKDSWKY